MQIFSLLSQLLGPNAAFTKLGVTKCRIAPPPFLSKMDQDSIMLLIKVSNRL